MQVMVQSRSTMRLRQSRVEPKSSGLLWKSQLAWVFGAIVSPVSLLRADIMGVRQVVWSKGGRHVALPQVQVEV